MKVVAQDHSVTAIHESGYAVLTTKLPAGDNILEITIEWSWSILGSIAHTPATGGFRTVERRVRSIAQWLITRGALIVDAIILGSD